ncbi:MULTISPECIES: S24 family peptidase [Burkholderia]|uniref:S24 family peptidase n=1 Tax=Burkholderia TaxID=32008 RepID=UPI000AF4D2AB|nr:MULTISPECIES: S24 family peptidase [Burkholderia]
MKIQEIRRARLREWTETHPIPSKEKSYFSQLLGGGSFGERAARRLERDYEMGEGYLDTPFESLPGTLQLPEDKGNVLVWEHPEDLPPDDDRVWLDKYDYKFSAGTGLIQWEVREKKQLPFDVGFFKALGVKPQDCKLVQVHGRSMEPYLFNRDMMMICTTRTHVRDGRVYAVYFEDEPLVKQIFKEPEGALRLHSYNPEFPDRVVTADQLGGLQIAGEVMYRSGSGLAGGN